MRAIYEPRGPALEYCERAANLYRGCDHGCRYCYAPGALRMDRAAFHGVPRTRDGVLGAIKKDAPKHAGREVLLCFTCDPYQRSADSTTREAILALQAAGCRVTILTKGGMRSAPDLEILRPGLDKYGATLTFVHEGDSLFWEPGAAPPDERITVLRMAKARGLATWASLEPVIDPEQSLSLIRATAGVVDVYKLGKWNHTKDANAIDWRDYGKRAVALVESIGAQYMVKRDLRVAMEG